MKTVVLDQNGDYVRDCEVDEIGVIVMRGPNVFKGYVEEAHNKGAWVQGDWLNTGDMGRMDNDQYFWLTGRKKELIIRGGHNIDPAVIEEVLYKIDGVALAAAVGRPDAHAGEVPVAYITPKPGAKLDLQKIEAYCRENIAERAAIPKEISVIDPMPVTAVGKVFKPALRHDAIKRVFDAELGQLSNLVEGIEVQVGEHKVHGTIAMITATPSSSTDATTLRRQMDNILGRFTVHYEVVV
jgi:fatty-acyl-CoA synthase